MLVPAYTKQEELQIKLASTMLDPYYKYYHASYPDVAKIDDGFWSKIQLVSLDRKGKVCGYFNAETARPENFISSLHMLNFDKNKSMLFALDLKNFFRYLLIDFGAKKINFTVVIDNPIVKQYDIMVERLGGRIVGIKKYNSLIGNKYYDLKLYEIINNHYECSHCGYITFKTKLLCRKCGKSIMKFKKAFED